MNNTNLTNIDDFFIKLKNGKISNENKEILYNLVISLEKGTKLQKERFILFYNLNSENSNYNFTSLGKQQNCSSPAIRYSIVRLRSFLVNLKDERKEIFEKLIKDS